MRLSNRRKSTHIEDARGQSGGGLGNLGGSILGGLGNMGGGKGKVGCVSILIMLLLAYCMSGGDIGKMMQNIQLPDVTQTTQSGQQTTYEPSEEEEQVLEIVSKVLAGTEDVWTARFSAIGKTYQPPTLHVFTGSVQSGCGNATSQVGPFYCSADQKIYIDLSFLTTMRSSLGVTAKGDLDFAFAYVIAHEVGHAVQDQLGILSDAHQQMAKQSEKEANRTSVRIELQADYLAGVWAHFDNQQYNLLEDGDLEEAINTAEKIGDDYLQKKAQGYEVPDAFTHGTSAQREKWLKRGLNCSDTDWLQQGMQTFKVDYDQL